MQRSRHFTLYDDFLASHDASPGSVALLNDLLKSLLPFNMAAISVVTPSNKLRMDGVVPNRARSR